MSDTNSKEEETPANGEPEEAEASDNKVAELSPEEQMELYEESLKEDDWGHQPC